MDGLMTELQWDIEPTGDARIPIRGVMAGDGGGLGSGDLGHYLAAGWKDEALGIVTMKWHPVPPRLAEEATDVGA
jgi:hypothetical protein